MLWYTLFVTHLLQKLNQMYVLDGDGLRFVVQARHVLLARATMVRSPHKSQVNQNVYECRVTCVTGMLSTPTPYDHDDYDSVLLYYGTFAF